MFCPSKRLNIPDERGLCKPFEDGQYRGISVEKRVFTQNRFHLLNFYQSTLALADDLQSLKRFTKPTVFEAFQRELFFRCCDK